MKKLLFVLGLLSTQAFGQVGLNKTACYLSAQTTKCFLPLNVTIAGSTGLTLNGSSSGSTILQATAAASGTLTLPAATDTLVGLATTDTLTNKTLTSPKLNENVAVTTTATKLNYLTSATGTTGTTSTNVVFSTSPTFVTPTLGAATATSINFGGTTLANYVEGTFTPTVLFSGTSAPTYPGSIETGNYTRIGNRVFFQIVMTFSKNTSTLIMTVEGLPITSKNTGNIFNTISVLYEGFTTPANKQSLTGYINTNSTTIIMEWTSAVGGAVSQVVAGDLSATATLYITGSYQI